MAARQTKTPGQTTAPAQATPTAAEQKDVDIEAILGTPEKDAETTASTEATSTASTASEPVTPEPTAEDLQAKKEYEEFLAWRKNKAGPATKEPVAQHVGTSDATTPKRTRQVVGPHGWTTEEY